VRRHRPLIEQVEALDRDRCRAQRRAAPSKSPESLIRGGSKDVPEQRCKALVPLPSRPPLESPASAATNNEKAVGIERRGGGEQGSDRWTFPGRRKTRVLSRMGKVGARAVRESVDRGADVPSSRPRLSGRLASCPRRCRDDAATMAP
jgi:hypothetical protein